ncbi:MAG: hypothetical protein ACUVTL_03590 [Thermoproteota archaeon]
MHREVDTVLLPIIILSTIIPNLTGTQVKALNFYAKDFTIILRANASSAVVGEVIQFVVTVTPFEGEQEVRLYLMVGQNWKELVSARTVNGSFTYNFKVQSQGIYELKASILAGGVAHQSEVVKVRFFASSIFARLLIEDRNVGELAKLRSFKESLRNGLASDRSIYLAFYFFNSILCYIVESPLWPSLRFFFYPELWIMIASRDVFFTFGSSIASLLFHGLLFGSVYLTGPVLLIGYYSRIGLTPIRWKKILGVPSLILLFSLVVLAFSPFTELGCVAALIASFNASLLPSFSMAKLLNL